jgi:two-component system NtrC family sensor kinase
MSMVHGIITIKDLEGRYQLVNPAAVRFLGLPRTAFVGKTAWDLFPPEVAETIDQHDAEVVQQGGHLTHEEHFTLGGKDKILVSERILLSDYRDEPVGICCVSRNETQQRRLQRELLQSEKHAAVGKLAAGVAHELNNPLTGILTFAEDLLEEAPQGSTSREDLELIVRETLRCRQIVRELLDFSRRTPPDRKLVGIEPILQRALSLVRHQASFHDIDLELDLRPPRLLVRVDPNQIQQVILNLVINARDAMDGRGRIVVRTSELEDPPRQVLEIVDNGCGVPEELLERIFEPFFSTKGDQGMGLGLTSVRNIVEAHDGRIVVESTEGQGSVFRMLLPGVPLADAGGSP